MPLSCDHIEFEVPTSFEQVAIYFDHGTGLVDFGRPIAIATAVPQLAFDTLGGSGFDSLDAEQFDELNAEATLSIVTVERAFTTGVYKFAIVAMNAAEFAQPLMITETLTIDEDVEAPVEPTDTPAAPLRLRATLLSDNRVLLIWEYLISDLAPTGFHIYAGETIDYNAIAATVPYRGVGILRTIMPSTSGVTRYAVRAYREGTDDGNTEYIVVTPLIAPEQIGDADISCQGS